MRMNQEAEKTAADIINGYEYEDLEKILNTPLETFGNKELDDLKHKYEE
jgi:16S rRNA C1402 N4-methylase RsmH